MRKKKIEDVKAEQFNQNIIDLVKSNGWVYAKNLLKRKMVLLDSVSDIKTDGLTAQQIGEEALARVMAGNMAMQWLEEIEGHAFNAEQARDSILRIREEILINLDES
jgi:hypothetical protein